MIIHSDSNLIQTQILTLQTTAAAKTQILTLKQRKKLFHLKFLSAVGYHTLFFQ